VRFASADETLGRRAVVYFASGQKDGEFVAFICSAFTGLTASTPQDDTSATRAHRIAGMANRPAKTETVRKLASVLKGH